MRILGSSRSREGFSLIELLIFAAIFAAAAVAFTTVLVIVTQIQVRQSGAAQVNQESQFVLQTIQRLIDESVMIDIPAGTPTQTLTLRNINGPNSQICWDTEEKKIYLDTHPSDECLIPGGTPVALTTDRVRVTDLKFTKRSNPPGPDSVSITFLLESSASTPTEFLSQALRTTVARVASAVVFDDDLIPNSDNARDLGVLPNSRWRSINQALFFDSSGNIGIADQDPSQRLEVDGGIIIDTFQMGIPTCDENNPQNRGALWFVPAVGPDSTDVLMTCTVSLDADEVATYGWTPL